MQVSLRITLAGVAYACVVAASLAYASVFWGSLMFSIALAALGVAALGRAYQRGAWRAFSTGFLAFGLTYLLLVFAPPSDRIFGHRLVTTKLLAYAEPVIRQTEEDLAGAFRDFALLATDPVQEVLIQMDPENRVPPQRSAYQQAGHSAFLLLLAGAGGLLARSMYLASRDQEGVQDSTTTPQA